jgi:hypothetical protein
MQTPPAVRRRLGGVISPEGGYKANPIALILTMMITGDLVNSWASVGASAVISPAYSLLASLCGGSGDTARRGLESVDVPPQLTEA